MEAWKELDNDQREAVLEHIDPDWRDRSGIAEYDGHGVFYNDVRAIEFYKPDADTIREALEDYDPTPYCDVCGSMSYAACSCPKPFYCNNH